MGLPLWIVTLLFILLSIGLPVVATLSWIFDITSQGIKKTESLKESAGIVKLITIWSSEIKELERLYESLKGQRQDMEKELAQLIQTDDANVIMLYSRRCLEVIISDLCEWELKKSRKTEPLQGIIDKLNKEEKVPSHIIASMHGLNSLATFGTLLKTLILNR